MMDDSEFDFRIAAYSPDTIPMERLARYLTELATLMGNAPHVHFKGLRKGSTVVRAVVEQEDIPKVQARLQLVGRPDAPPDVVKCIKAINGLLREDNARGTLKHVRTAQIIKFPGAEEALPARIGPIKEAGVLDGEIVRVGGKDRTIHIQLIGPDGQEYKLVTTSRDIAKQIAQHLYMLVRVSGTGTWYRNEEGDWELESFAIQDFGPLEDRSLIEAVAALQAIEGSDWQDTDDPLSAWQRIRSN